MNHLGDTNKMVETLRTDAAKKIVLGGVGGDWEVVHIAFSRQLERELNAANERIKRLEEESESRWHLAQSAIGSCAEMSSRIKRLKEAGDAMHKYIGVTHDSDRWNEAKEETKQ